MSLRCVLTFTQPHSPDHTQASAPTAPKTKSPGEFSFLATAHFLEIYNERVFDLLDPGEPTLALPATPLSYCPVTSSQPRLASTHSPHAPHYLATTRSRVFDLIDPGRNQIKFY